jgi:hypothetical protein
MTEPGEIDTLPVESQRNTRNEENAGIRLSCMLAWDLLWIHMTICLIILGMKLENNK